MLERLEGKAFEAESLEKISLASDAGANVGTNLDRYWATDL